MKSWFMICLAGLSAAGAAGCTRTDTTYVTEARRNNGLVIILPGIEGESPFNHDIRRGLVDAGVLKAMPIYKWGRPVPVAGLLLNQVDVIGNRIEADRIAKMIVQYQDCYPGRPVYLVGHSGGGGIAVFTAESLPPGRTVQGLILLSASISPGYNLTKALSHTDKGIVNFYNETDVAVLGLGTTLVGNVDRMPGPSAGLAGFKTPDDSAPPEKCAAYQRLYQVSVSSLKTIDEPHSASTRASFVRRYVAPWISTAGWPTQAMAQRMD